MMQAADPFLMALGINHAPVRRPKKIELDSEFWFCVVDEVGLAPKKQVLISDIQEATARHFDVTVNDLLSARRGESLPRHIAMYLCKVLTARSYTAIARVFDRCDHTIAMYAFKKISHLIKNDAEIAGRVSQIARALA